MSPSSRRLLFRLGLVALLALTAGGFYAAGGLDYLRWDALRERLEPLGGWVRENLVIALAGYVLLYAAVTGLSLPVATPLSLVGGAVFGRWLGTLAVSVGSTLGASLAFLSSRYLFRDLAERWLGARLTPINRGVEADGAFYVLTLRMVPAFPFFLVNLALGLTRLRLATFWWASQLGMLPATFVYVNTGAELGALASPKDVLSPTVVGSLALLGVLPLLLRWVVRWIRPTPDPAPPAAPPPEPNS